MIWIRTDANARIATGHLMRTLTIARECVRRAIPVRFILADEESLGILQGLCTAGEELSATVLRQLFQPGTGGISYRQPEAELSALEQLLEQERPDCLLIDSYFVTESYLKRLKSYTRTIYIDDLRAFDYPVDTVINYDVLSERTEEEYRRGYRQAGECLLGAGFTPLRSQFTDLPYQVRERAAHILIATGGGDSRNAAGRLLEKFLAENWEGNQKITYHVVIGALHEHKPQLQTLAARHDNICLHEKVQNMAELMAGCDLAVSAAGTTLYELCAVGVPAVSFTLADNQIASARAFDAAGAVVYSGDARNEAGGTKFPEAAVRLVSELAASYELRRQRSGIMRRLIDGQGVARIVDHIWGRRNIQ